MSAILISPDTSEQDLLSHLPFSSENRALRAIRTARVLLIGAFSLAGLISFGGDLSAQAQTAVATSAATRSATRAATSAITARVTASATSTATATATASPIHVNPDALPLTIWYTWQGDDGQLLQTALDSYQAAHKDLAITSQSIDVNGLTYADFIDILTSARRAGQSPTIVLIPAGWIADLGDASLLAAIPPDAISHLRASIMDSAWNAVTYHKQIYGIPQSLQCVGLFDNPALDSSQPLTADALMKMANVSVSFNFYSTAGIFFGSGGSLSQLDDLMSRRLIEAPPALTSYLTAIHDWYTLIAAATPIPYPTTIGLIPPTAPTPAVLLPSDTGFRDGQLPYAISDNNLLSAYQLALPTVAVQPLPDFANGAHWQSLVETQAFAITTDDPKRRTAALDLISALLDPKMQTQIGDLGNYLPASVPAGRQLSDPRGQALASQCQTGIFPSPEEARLLRTPLLDDAVFAVTSGGQSPAQVANHLAEQLVPTVTSTIVPTLTLTPTVTLRAG